MQPKEKGDPSTATTIDLVQKLVNRLRDLSTESDTAEIMAGASLKIELELRDQADSRTTVQLAITRGGASSGGLSATGFTEDPAAQLEFNAEGHHVIALIAARALETEAPDVMAAVQRILDDGDRTLEEAATFPDDIRDSQPETKPFHFVDIPFQEGGPINPPLPHVPHVVSKIASFTTELANGGTPQEKVDALSWLIHLFGDVHQPLHCIERISPLHPGGDRGGNSFRLTGPRNNLHSLWDSAVNISAPLEEAELRDQIMEAHPRESLQSELAVASPVTWARKSHALARRHAYSLTENPQNPPRPGTAYLRNMERIGRRQAALGGYRLADRLVAILGGR